jgi:hypothetical protein
MSKSEKVKEPFSVSVFFVEDGLWNLISVVFVG